MNDSAILLSDTEKAVLSAVQRIIDGKYFAAECYLYGSRAGGAAKTKPYQKKAGRKIVELKESDYDVCVLLRSRGAVLRTDPEINALINRETGANVNVVFCAEKNEWTKVSFNDLNLF